MNQQIKNSKATPPVSRGRPARAGAAVVASCRASSILRNDEEVRTVLDMATKGANIGVWRWDVAADRLAFNAEMHRMLGYGRNRLPTTPIAFAELVHDEDAKAVSAALRLQKKALPACDQPFKRSLRLRHKGGGWVHAVLIGQTVERAPDGAALALAGVYVDVSEQLLIRTMMKATAYVDDLTQLPNRAAVHELLQRALTTSKGDPKQGFALLFLDFDQFKRINDALGHGAGDDLLRQIAERLQHEVRHCDTVITTAGSPAPEVAGIHAAPAVAGRIGGDEFVVLLEQVATTADVETVAKRLLHRLAEPYQLGPSTVRSTVSIGIVTSWGESRQTSVEELMRDADTAMYEAKRAGRGRFVTFEQHMHERVARQHVVENALRLALGSDEVSPVYQPIIDLQTMRLCSVEALARWNSPTLGPVSPVEFIPIAEEFGLIELVWQTLLPKACRDFREWRARFGEDAPETLSVNLSRAQVLNPSLPRQIEEALRDSGLEPACLQLEITESMAGDDEKIRETLGTIRAMGVQVALDDFGTGHSSLSFLEDMPVNAIKIDRSFLKGVEQSNFKQGLIVATVNMATIMGLKVVAEGVETAEQNDLVKRLGVDHGQGYLYSHPLGATALCEWLDQRLHGSHRLIPVRAAPGPVGHEAVAATTPA